MSTCVEIRTKKRIEPKVLFEELANQGEGIMLISDSFPVIKFGNMHTALRGVEVTEEDYGYEVRVCMFASEEDFRLFLKTILALKKMTNGQVFTEEGSDNEYTSDISELYNDAWIEEQRIKDVSVIKSMVNYSGTPVVLFGLFEQICIGPILLNDFDILNNDNFSIDEVVELQDYLISVQWELVNKESTRTRMVIKNPNDEYGREKSISLIGISNGKVDDFDFISHADLLGIIDSDNQGKYPPVLMPFDKIFKILPTDIFRGVDDLQFLKEEELTVDMVHEMMEKASIYTPEDIHYKPTMPGDGFDEKQNTFILRWNPSFSSVKTDDYIELIEKMLTSDFNWSVWEYEKAKCGDRFFLVKVGEGETGIVLSGVFESNPYQAGDWSGKGRVIHYMDMKPNVILNSETVSMLSVEKLQQEIPSVTWGKGHSGELISDEDAKKLELLWQEFIESNEDNFDGINMRRIKTF